MAAIPESHTAFRAALPDGLIAFTKSGELEGVRCEVGYVELPGRPYTAAVLTTYLRRERDGEAAIRDVSAAVYETFDRFARSSEHGRGSPSSEGGPAAAPLEPPLATRK